jgi:cytochrome c oxidase subunit 2
MAFSHQRAPLSFLITASVVALSACGESAKYPQTTFDPVSEFGRLLNSLFAITFWWTIGILVLVEVLLLVFVWRFRERPGAPEPKRIHGHTGLEILWTFIPAVIVLFIAVPTIRGVFATQRTASEDALVVEVIGHQWWWEFRYPEQGVVTANELVLPINREVDLRLHSADVVHSFWIPRVGGKRDVNPQPRTVEAERARVNHLGFTIEQVGYYAGQCAEFCGESHALMRSAVIAMTEQDFNEWVSSMGGAMTTRAVGAEPQPGATTAEKVPPAPGEAVVAEGGVLGMPRDTLTVADTLNAAQRTPPQTVARTPVNPTSPTGAPAPGRGVHQDVGPVPPGATQTAALSPGEPNLEQRGQELFTTRVCVACHTINGTAAKGTLGPNLTRFGIRRSVAAGAAPNTLQNVEKWINRPQDLKPGALMPGAREGGGGMPATGLSPDEVRAMAAYLKSLQ